MTTRTESVVCIYDDQKRLVAILKRDEGTGHKIMHNTSESEVEDIVSIIEPNHSLI